MSKDLWLIDYEFACDEFSGGQIDETEFSARLRALGFDPHEIDNHLSALATDDDQGSPVVTAPSNEEVIVP